MFDRVYGKPVQPTQDVPVALDDKSWDEMTEEERQAALDGARRRWQERSAASDL